MSDVPQHIIEAIVRKTTLDNLRKYDDESVCKVYEQCRACHTTFHHLYALFELAKREIFISPTPLDHQEWTQIYQDQRVYFYRKNRC